MTNLHRYEPLFDEMYKASEQDGSTFKIRSIWIADVSSHGASGVLNEGRLGNEREIVRESDCRLLR